MLHPDGIRRVVIANVKPEIEGGAYAAKATIREPFPISADIFCDGHDRVDASVWVRHHKDRGWKEYPMQFRGNDRWKFVCYPQVEGMYRVRIGGWRDTFGTWKHGLMMKYGARQDISVDLQAGVALIEAAVQEANARERRALLKWVREMATADDEAAIVTLVQSDVLAALMRTCRNKETVTEYHRELFFEVEREKASFSTWYELFPRSTSPEPGRHGTFRDVVRLLPRIATMGFDTLYFPPIHPIGRKHRKGKNNSLIALPDDPGSPWAVGSSEGGHKSIHPELGTMDDFRMLIAEAGKLGLEIALDLAFQCAPDHPYVSEHPEWFFWRPDGTVQYAENPPKKYEDILPFHFETEHWESLWRELKSIVDYWIDAGVRIFRVDNPHTKPFRFWEWLIREVRKKHPQVIFLAEAFTRPRVMERLAQVGFSQSYTYFTWRNTPQELEAYMRELVDTDMRYYFRPNFWPNTPDILPPVLSEGGENAHIIRLVLAATLSSSYGIYGPVYELEWRVPMPGKEEYIDNEKYEIRFWDWNLRTRLGELITRINRIRREHTAFHSTWNLRFAHSTDNHILCYIKADPIIGNRLIVVVNTDPFQTHSGEVQITPELLGMEERQDYTVRDLLSGDVWQWGEWNYVSLDPYRMPAHILLVDDKTTAG